MLVVEGGLLEELSAFQGKHPAGRVDSPGLRGKLHLPERTPSRSGAGPFPGGRHRGPLSYDSVTWSHQELEETGRNPP